MKYVVLLRGINVGGKNRIPMAELRMCLDELRYVNVQTYIASGNVILESDKSAKELTEEIQDILPQKFKLDDDQIKVLVLAHGQLKKVINQAPKGFGSESDKYHTDVIFLIGIASDEALKIFNPREGVDKIWQGDLVVYSQRLSAERTKSRLSAIVASPLYKSMTIRTYGTVQKLLSLLEAK